MRVEPGVGFSALQVAANAVGYSTEMNAPGCGGITVISGLATGLHGGSPTSVSSISHKIVSVEVIDPSGALTTYTWHHRQRQCLSSKTSGELCSLILVFARFIAAIARGARTSVRSLIPSSPIRRQTICSQMSCLHQKTVITPSRIGFLS